MAIEVKHRRHRWLGNVLRMEEKRIPKKGIRLNPPGKRKHGRPKMTLRKTFDEDFNCHGERPRWKKRKTIIEKNE